MQGLRGRWFEVAVLALVCPACGGSDETVLLPPTRDLPTHTSGDPPAPSDPPPLDRPPPPAAAPLPLPIVDESALPDPERRTGFIEIDETEYAWMYLPGVLTSTRTRLFYNLIPADTDAKARPVFVLFNGGPGATSMYLQSLGTGPSTLLDVDWSAPPGPNPSSLSALGSLLYIDCRLSGFSYGLSNTPQDEAERERAFSDQNLNPVVDGADFVRVLLRVLAAQPALQNNPVVLLGESAGGMRAAVMLQLLLDVPPAPGEPRLYEDAKLAAELEQHYAAVFGDDAGPLTPETKAHQFGWQVLIQPGVLWPWQDEFQDARRPERLERLSTLPGYVGESCDHQARSAEWCDGRDDAVNRAMGSPAEFDALIGASPRAVAGLSAAERDQAFRCGRNECPDDPFLAPEPSSAWSSALGELSPYDHYFMTFAESPFPYNLMDQDHTRFPFVRVVPYVETLITNARWDSVIDSEAILHTLRAYIDGQATPWLVAAEYSGRDPDEVSEEILLHYRAHPSYGPARTRRVRFPAYLDSGHMVTVSEPAKFRDDVRAFLEQTGALAPPP